MADQEVKLLGLWGSPYTRRVEIALNLKGVNYEFVTQDVANKSPELLKYNPVHKKLPVLLHNGKPIAESLVIVEYIDETWTSGTPILPKDSYGKAMARFWTKFIDDKCLPAIFNIKKCQDEEQKKAIEEAVEPLKVLENELKGKKFFDGENIGLADIASTFISLWLGIYQEIMEISILTTDKLPRLCEWANVYLNSDVIKQSLPPRDELAPRLRSYYNPTK